MSPLAGKNVRALSLSENGTIASGSEDSSVRLFSIQGATAYKKCHVKTPQSA
jgi:hypothetical protein